MRTIFIKAACLFFSALLLNQPVIAQNKEYKAYVVSNAHLDTQWNWDVQASIKDFLPSTMTGNYYYLTKYPNYIFNFEGGIKYSWMKEYYPNQYSLVKDMIKKGRWNVVGASWDANDTNLPSPESALRNILYAQKYYKEEFRVQSEDIFLPDCFGFSWTLPSIAAHCGLIGFSTQKLQWRTNPMHNGSKVPFDIGLWKGVDGSEVMAALNGNAYDTKWTDNDLSTNTSLLEKAKNSPLNTVFHYYGVGDAGGYPTEESVKAVENGISGSGPLEIIGAKSQQLYKDYLPFSNHPELPVYEGELLIDVHGTGCYTSQAALKLYNRKNELLADAAERAAVVADWFGAIDYPQQTLSEAWKRVLWHQFHDDLPGTSIPRAYEFSWNDELISMKQFAGVLTSSVGGVSRNLNTQVQGVPLVVYNPISNEVSDVIEATVKISDAQNGISVYDANGVEVPSQVVSINGETVKLLVAVSAPSCGYAVYDIRNQASTVISGLHVTANRLENSTYKVVLNKNGDISSITDKRDGRELIDSGKSIRLAVFTDNPSTDWPAWEIKKSVIDNTPVAITDNVKISIVEDGPVRIALCIERTYGESLIKQYIRLTANGQDDRIDVYNEFDWKTKNILLKAEFPLSVANPKATYDLGLGAIQRGNNTTTAYEVCGQFWADLTNTAGNYGVSILNDSRYGWDKPSNNTLRLTLLHIPRTGEGYKYQADQDLGFHTFKYSIVGHAGNHRDANTVLKAEVFNQPIKAFVVGKHDGVLDKSFSFVKVSNENVLIKAIKKAEESDEYIVRVYETSGISNQAASLEFIGNIASAKEVNGIEEDIADVQYADNKLNFEVKPYSLKTFKIKLAQISTTLSSPKMIQLPLPFNLRTTTFDGNENLANIDGKNNSYAAELFPDQVNWKGVTFDLGSRDGINALKSNGTTIDLPSGHSSHKLYLLAASMTKDNMVDFVVDGETHSASVPYYSGYIGQWGQKGYTEEIFKETEIAYLGTHKHTSSTGSKLNEVYENTVDKNTKTKYTVTGKKTFWLHYQLPKAKKVKSYLVAVPVTSYVTRNPKDWTFSGWDAKKGEWIILDQQSGIIFPENGSAMMFDVASEKEYSAYLLEVTANNGSSDVHLLQWQLFEDSLAPSGIETIQPDVSALYTVYGRDRRIVIESIQNDEATFYIYNLQGALVATGTTMNDITEIAVASGLYVVRVNNFSTKVLVSPK